MKIYILYEYGYEHCRALQAYEEAGEAEDVMVKCIEYEENTPMMDYDMDCTDKEFQEFQASQLIWIANHPMKIDHSDCGYRVGELDLKKSD